jgi:hypothetical protein
MDSVEVTSVIYYQMLALASAVGMRAKQVSLVLWAMSDLSSPMTLSSKAYLTSREIEGSSYTFLRIEYLCF